MIRAAIRTVGGKRGLRRSVREWGTVAAAALSERRPLLVHVVPMRRCNLACAYCNEYDAHSEPVPTGEMLRRIDRLGVLGTAVVTISGGEPLLHPDLDEIIARIKRRGMVATLITNGYLLVRARIEALNRVGLDRLQISIDNVEPDEISMKSLKVLDRKLQALAELARFEVNINSVVGAKVAHPGDALAIAGRARELGFTATMGVIHDGEGHLDPLSAGEREAFEAFQALGRFSLTRFNRTFQTNLASGRANRWRCRAGSRYFYVCEHGLVHYCSQQRGYPAIPIEEYGLEDIRREHRRPKACSPFCTIACVHQASAPDHRRSPQDGVPFEGVGAPGPQLVPLRGRPRG